MHMLLGNSRIHHDRTTLLVQSDPHFVQMYIDCLHRERLSLSTIDVSSAYTSYAIIAAAL